MSTVETTRVTGEQRPSIVFTNTNLPDILELRHVRQTYANGKVCVLDDFNLLVENIPNRGQFEVMLGPSGCGKSTVLRYLTGLQQPTSGEVLLYGRPITRDPGVTMVFQDYSSLPWLTVQENVELPLELKGVPGKERRERARALLAEVGLSGHEHKFAKYPNLSGGQLQRVAIARSLVANPKVIMMDEPFGALDTITRLKMQLLLHQLWRKGGPEATIIFVTHDLQEAIFLGTRIHIMSNPPGAHIVDSLEVDLPVDRTKETKRTPEFIALLARVDDLMEGVGYTHGSAYPSTV